MKRTLVIAAALLIVAAVAGGLWLQPGHAPGPTPDTGTKPPAVAPKPIPNQQAATKSPETRPPPAPKGFCARDFSDVAARVADAPKLQRAGGVVHIFERQNAPHPYACATFYLQHGLDINAVDPRPDHDPLTGLDFAIKRNDPKMVRFMIKHGADLHQRATAKHLKPYGYAMYLALNDPHTDRNQVIDILDKALSSEPARSSAKPDGNTPHHGSQEKR